MLSPAGSAGEISHSFCKLLVAIDHSTFYLASNLASPALVTPVPQSSNTPRTMQPQTNEGPACTKFPQTSSLIHRAPGFYGTNEDESETTLGFWHLFQEALWSTDYYIEDGEGEDGVVAEGVACKETE
jgi:hypothetical protein